MKNIIIGILVVVVIALVAGIFIFDIFRAQSPDVQPSVVTSFEECAAAGNPIMESYPRQCSTPDGKHFTENIGNELDKSDLIRLSAPRPGATVTSPLTITGEARGNWYFEASFPVHITDANGNELGVVPAQAEGEWMTTEFVPFKARLVFSEPTTETGFLILKKDNPSGLPEHDDELKIPISFGSKDE